MGRTPCCDKTGMKKGPWTPEEDQKLLAYVEENGHGSWRALPAKAGLQRCGKSCRLRWTNYLRPDIKRGKFSLQEEQTIIQLHALLGNRWSAIATHLQKRTDNEIKNYWNTHLKKRLAKMGIDPVTHKPQNDALLSGDGQSKSAANLSHMAQWESARLEAEARLVRQSRLRAGSDFASASSRLQKAWNGGLGGKTSEAAAGASGGVSVAGVGEMESPTSTLGSAVVGEGSSGLMKAEGEEEWKQAEYGSSTAAAALPAAWGSENVARGSFVEKFTDLLLNASSGDQRFSDDGGDSDNNGGSGGGGGDCYEDKNYWNSILNLVNASPSHSPIF